MTVSGTFSGRDLYSSRAADYRELKRISPISLWSNHGLFADRALGSNERVRLTRYGVPAEVAEGRPELFLSPQAPGKAINAPGSERRHDGGVFASRQGLPST